MIWREDNCQSSLLLHISKLGVRTSVNNSSCVHLYSSTRAILSPQRKAEASDPVARHYPPAGTACTSRAARPLCPTSSRSLSFSFAPGWRWCSSSGSSRASGTRTPSGSVASSSAMPRRSRPPPPARPPSTLATPYVLLYSHSYSYSYSYSYSTRVDHFCFCFCVACRVYLS